MAELELFHSRPHAPTRRLALGSGVLPTTPSPGFGGILLGGVVATFASQVDPDLVDDLHRLLQQLEAGHRIAQPRLRHRLQQDRVGLTAYRHRLVGRGEDLSFEMDQRGNPMPHVLGAIYAAGQLDPAHRGAVFSAIRRGLRWRGDVGPRLVAHLGDSRSATNWATLGGVDPTHWALDVLGLPAGVTERVIVQQRFRELLRASHPDHGAQVEGAAQRINELTEARRILLDR